MHTKTKIAAVIVSCLLPTAWGAKQSTDISSISGLVPNSILVMETGFIPWANAPVNAEARTFNTTKSCPANFNPYVSMSISKTFIVNNQAALQAFGACVQLVAGNSGVYSVTYLSSLRYSPAVTVPQPSYLGTNSGCYTGVAPCTSTPFPVSKIPDSNQWNNQNVNAVGGVTWTLYCYPAGIGLMPPPPYDSECAIGQNPF